MSKKVYIIKGFSVDLNGEHSWIESVTLSESKSKKIKNELNNNLEIKILDSRGIFDKFVKKESIDLPWEEIEFHTNNMNEEEFSLFCVYRYGKLMPYKIEEINLV